MVVNIGTCFRLMGAYGLAQLIHPSIPTPLDQLPQHACYILLQSDIDWGLNDKRGTIDMFRWIVYVVVSKYWSIIP